MPHPRKIATCCYCGLRAFLVLDQSRHELACSGCGAPLHEMKAMPLAASCAKTAAGAQPARSQNPKAKKSADRKRRRNRPEKGRGRRRKPLFRQIFEEVWDEIEDILD